MLAVSTHQPVIQGGPSPMMSSTAGSSSSQPLSTLSSSSLSVAATYPAAFLCSSVDVCCSHHQCQNDYLSEKPGISGNLTTVWECQGIHRKSGTCLGIDQKLGGKSCRGKLLVAIFMFAATPLFSSLLWVTSYHLFHSGPLCITHFEDFAAE